MSLDYFHFQNISASPPFYFSISVSHMSLFTTQEKATLPLLVKWGKCVHLWQMNDVKETYLYSFRSKEEENPSVTDVKGAATRERACWGVCLRGSVRGARVGACVPRYPSFVINESCFCVGWFQVCPCVCACVSVCMWVRSFPGHLFRLCDEWRGEVPAKPGRFGRNIVPPG